MARPDGDVVDKINGLPVLKFGRTTHIVERVWAVACATAHDDVRTLETSPALGLPSERRLFLTVQSPRAQGRAPGAAHV